MSKAEILLCVALMLGLILRGILSKNKKLSNRGVARRTELDPPTPRAVLKTRADLLKSLVLSVSRTTLLGAICGYLFISGHISNRSNASKETRHLTLWLIVVFGFIMILSVPFELRRLKRSGENSNLKDIFLSSILAMIGGVAMCLAFYALFIVGI
jgi:hypothetical protein